MKIVKTICKGTGYLIAAGLIFFISFSPAFGQGNIHLGRMKVDPSIGYQLKYDDNIFLTSKDTKNDFIHLLKPNIKLGYIGSDGNYLNFGYSADIAIYTDYSENNYLFHNPYISAGYKSPKGFYIKGDESFVYTADPYGSENTYKLGTKTKRWNNTAGGIVGYEFADKYAIEGEYQNFIERYSEQIDKWQNRTDNQFGISVLYKIAPKTKVFGQYRYTTATYNEQDDGIYGWSDTTSQNYILSDVFAGVRFEPGGKIRGEVKIGYGEKKFDNSMDRKGLRYDDNKTWIAESNVEYQASERTSMKARIIRTQNGSPDADSTSYVDTLFGIGLEHKLSERFAMGGWLGWNNNDYEGESNNGRPKRYFDIYTAKANVEYKIMKWLTSSLEYQFRTKKANDSAYELEEYDNNIVTLSLTGKF